MSAITEEIVAIETELHNCLDTDAPIDSKKLKKLYDLRLERLKELVGTHAERMAVMKDKTREMTAKLIGLELSAKPDLKDQFLAEQDKFDAAAVHWVNYEKCLWGESEAASIAAGILILAA